MLEAEYRAALAREEIHPASDLLHEVRWVLPDRPLTAEIAATLAAGRLRGADLWHVACAVWFRSREGELDFLTLSDHQRSVAAALGFAT